MKRLCLGLSLVLLMLVSPIVCFGDTVIPISGNAHLEFERGSGDIFQISGPGVSFQSTGFSAGPVAFCDPGTICTLELQAELTSVDDWSYPGLSDDGFPGSPGTVATADFTIFSVPFLFPASCQYEILEWAPACNPSVPASILGTVLFPAADGTYESAIFIGTGTLQLVGNPAVSSGWYAQDMDFQGTAVLTPEPGTFTLLCSGLAGLAAALRRRVHRMV
jgi:hypothetical protein